MDRTVIPNGSQAESPDARERFAPLCNVPQVTLVYVTGRHQALVKQAIADYQLPEADYAITDVGAIIYHIKNGNKLHAIEFLLQQLGYTLDEVIFAGDSGNDMPVLTSPVHSVLVANASDDVRQTALRIAKHNGHADALYLANTDALNMNGNYSAGVLQGIWHFVPGYRDIL